MKQIIIHFKNTDRVEIIAKAFRYIRSEERFVWTGHAIPGQPNLIYFDGTQINAIIEYNAPDDDTPDPSESSDSDQPFDPTDPPPA